MLCFGSTPRAENRAIPDKKTSNLLTLEFWRPVGVHEPQFFCVQQTKFERGLLKKLNYVVFLAALQGANPKQRWYLPVLVSPFYNEILAPVVRQRMTACRKRFCELLADKSTYKIRPGGIIDADPPRTHGSACWFASTQSVQFGSNPW